FYGAAGVSYYLDDIEYKQMIFTDDFESYTAGDLVAENSDYWGTWSGPAGGTGDDAEASEDYANTPVTSMKIGDDGADDMILPLGDATSGKYHIGFSILVESGGFEGYYNFQKTTTPGDEYAFDVYFNTDGTGSVEAGSGTMAFNFNQDEFNKIDHYIDLDNDSAYLYVNEMPIFSWQYSLDAAGDPGLNQLGGVDFYAWSDLGTGRSYIDDVVYGEYTWLPAEIVGATTTFSVTTMDSEPIENATIEVNGATLTTDATGLASIDLFDGNYNYTVTHPDYLTIESSVLVEGAEQTVDVMMQAVYNVTFNIDMTDAAGFDAESNFVWVSGASVDGEMGIGEFNPWQLPGAGAGIKLLDEDGDLTFTAIVPRVIPGDYEFRYYWTAGAPSNENGFPEEAEEALTFTVVDEDIAINTVWNGIDDVEALNYSIYPNPTNGEVNVTVNEACEVTVTNMLGQTVLIKTLNSNGTINLLDQRSGVYFVTAKTASRTATLKVLLK
ncbi:MAG: T9SS type A sorting domain-containing protein, partial [Salinivirgaceae bacterium]|nr:T9SS type A sorting domain-containing protein [Salinivirgaceae bacterium]